MFMYTEFSSVTIVKLSPVIMVSIAISLSQILLTMLYRISRKIIYVFGKDYWTFSNLITNISSITFMEPSSG